MTTKVRNISPLFTVVSHVTWVCIFAHILGHYLLQDLLL